MTAAPGPARAPARVRRPVVRGGLRPGPTDVIDVFVYVVVLNLAIEHVPVVISEGFTLSLLTAVVLKLALEVAIWSKGHVVRRLRAADTWPVKVVLGVALWIVAAGSKFAVLALIDAVFGDSVSLGGFLSVTALILALLLARAAVRRLLAETPAAG